MTNRTPSGEPGHTETYKQPMGDVVWPSYVYEIDTPGSKIDLLKLPDVGTWLSGDEALVTTRSGNAYFRTQTEYSLSTLFDLRSVADGTERSYTNLLSSTPKPIVVGERWLIPKFRHTSEVKKVFIPERLTVGPIDDSDELITTPFELVKDIASEFYAGKRKNMQLIAKEALARLAKY